MKVLYHGDSTKLENVGRAEIICINFYQFLVSTLRHKLVDEYVSDMIVRMTTAVLKCALLYFNCKKVDFEKHPKYYRR